MRIEEFKTLDPTQRKNLLELWNNEYPEKLTYHNLSDFEEYLQNLNETRHLFLLENQNEIRGWASAFTRDHERWFVIILSGIIQGKGYGKLLLDKLKLQEYELNGWVIDHNRDKKINGLSYKSPLGFYEKCNFKVLPTQRLELEIISAVKIKWERK